MFPKGTTSDDVVCIYSMTLGSKVNEKIQYLLYRFKTLDLVTLFNSRTLSFNLNSVDQNISVLYKQLYE